MAFMTLVSEETAGTRAQTTDNSTTAEATVSSASRGPETQAKESVPLSAATPRKTAKDPNAPKRPLNAFLFYNRDRRPGLRATHPDLPFGEYGRLVKQLWDAETVEVRERYEQEAREAKEEYGKRVKAYNEEKESHGSADGKDTEQSEVAVAEAEAEGQSAKKEKKEKKARKEKKEKKRGVEKDVPAAEPVESFTPTPVTSTIATENIATPVASSSPATPLGKKAKKAKIIAQSTEEAVSAAN
jgi:hypothetical protein